MILRDLSKLLIAASEVELGKESRQRKLSLRNVISKTSDFIE
jgi:hypothetical protein